MVNIDLMFFRVAITTSLYLHSDDDRRHRETEERHRIDW
jgi:hypothetical protein